MSKWISINLRSVTLAVYLFNIASEPILSIRRIRKVRKAPKHQGPPCSQRWFHFSLVLEFCQWLRKHEWYFIVMQRCRPFYIKISKIMSRECRKVSCSRLIQRVESIASRRRYTVSRVLSASVIRDGVKHGQMCFILYHTCLLWVFAHVFKYRSIALR